MSLRLRLLRVFSDGARSGLAALVLAAVLAFGCSGSGDPNAVGATSRGAAGRTLAATLDEIMEWYAADAFFLRLMQGLPIESLADLSHAEAQRDAADARRFLDRLGAIEARRLTPDERLSLEAVSWQLEMLEEGAEYHWLNFHLLPYSSPLIQVHRLFQLYPIRSAEDGESYLRLLGLYPALLDQVWDHLAEQEKQGIRIPKPSLMLVIPMVESWISPAESSLFLPAAERLAALDETAAEDFRLRAAALIDDEINPELRRLSFHLAGPYESAAPEDVGLWQFPDGDAYYRYLVRLYTTLDLEPEKIHQTGLAEVERINQRMAELREKNGRTGDKAPFHRYLQQHPRFRPKSADEIGRRLQAALAEMEAKVDELFSVKPEAPYGFARLDPTLEGGMTYGFYQAPTPAEERGLYLYNGSKPESRSLLWAKSLALHELVPGHHFQIARQRESEALHPIRREMGFTAYTEGWAEYAADLGYDVGLYDDFLDEYGRLAADMFLTVRLVVDTGMNFRRWPRAKAVDYMRRETLESSTQIGTETLRYSVDIPGQALAYKIGNLKLQELREEAREALGDDFDIREFHEEILKVGSLPLSVLEKHLRRWIAARQGSP